MLSVEPCKQEHATGTLLTVEAPESIRPGFVVVGKQEEIPFKISELERRGWRISVAAYWKPGLRVRWFTNTNKG